MWIGINDLCFVLVTPSDNYSYYVAVVSCKLSGKAMSVSCLRPSKFSIAAKIIPLTCTVPIRDLSCDSVLVISTISSFVCASQCQFSINAKGISCVTASKFSMLTRNPCCCD